ncbi:MAG TPA: thiol peroxidase [Pirellulaceae bacterium]|nr:thiol peroxidase [Pirellulaceae bacterium]
MAQITLKGNPINTCGELPDVGTTAPDFQLVAGDLSEPRLTDYRGKNVILNIVPSFDTGICAASVRRFNQAAGELEDAVIVNVSRDLPFAQKRFCDSEGLNHVINLSAFRAPRFGQDYGVELVDGPLRGLLGRAIVVVNGAGQVVYTELVPEIAQEPNYDAALSAVAQLA